MHADVRRRARGAPFPTDVLEIADQFLLLRVDGNRRAMLVLKPADLVVEIPKLRIPIRMRRAFARLAVRLQRVARVVQEIGHQPVADRMACRLQRSRQPPDTLGRPAQRRVRIARRGGLHQRLQIPHQRRVLRLGAFASAAHTRRERSVNTGRTARNFRRNVVTFTPEELTPIKLYINQLFIHNS